MILKLFVMVIVKLTAFGVLEFSKLHRKYLSPTGRSIPLKFRNIVEEDEEQCPFSLLNCLIVAVNVCSVFGDFFSSFFLTIPNLPTFFHIP